MTDVIWPPPVVRYSALRMMARSPAHMRSYGDVGLEQTPQMRFGTLVHTLILGGSRFEVFDGKARRGKAWDAFEEEHAGKLVVLREEHERALVIASKVRAHSIAGPFLEGEREVEVRWAWLGKDCGGRLDVLNAPLRRVVDVKTTPNANPSWFIWHARKMGYLGQLVWYAQGAAIARGLRDSSWEHVIVAVETKPPFAVTVFRLTPRAVEEGERQIRLWLERFIQCADADEWPEYSQSVVELDVPDDDVELVFADD
jgi:exodeoxyribonuclease VIII